MTHTVIGVGRDAPFKEIVRTMLEWEISALPVLGEDGRVIGVVSEADLLPKEEFRRLCPPGLDDPERRRDVVKAEAYTAGELMTSPAVTVRAGATLAEAARIMALRKVKRLPVTDPGGTLAGVVSRGDLLKVFLRTDEDIAEEVRREVTGPLFGEAAAVEVRVHQGMVVLAGRIPDCSLVPVAARLTRAVAGVVDVECAFAGPEPCPPVVPPLAVGGVPEA
ncbi:CBS domain-containing protein [Streptomyces sp. F63]|nr:CBS domain-containing protein [Streptomyces sp. F63]